MSTIPSARKVVTGATGFLGRALVADLASAAEPFVALRRGDGGDVTRDALPIRRGDHVFHLAALTGVPLSWDDPEAYLRVNTLGTVRVLDACRRAGASMTFASAYVYGSPRRLPVDEQEPTHPASPYALSKLMAEDACRFHAENLGVRCAILRLFNVFGPGQSRAFLIPRIVEQALDPGCREIVVMDLAPRRDFLYVTDAIAALRAVEELDAPLALFNVGSGRSHSVTEVIAAVCAAAGVDKPVRSACEPRRNEIPDVVADTSALSRATGWVPRVTLAEGLRRIVDDLRKSA